MAASVQRSSIAARAPRATTTLRTADGDAKVTASILPSRMASPRGTRAAAGAATVR